jgi:hypothetical protein
MAVLVFVFLSFGMAESFHHIGIAAACMTALVGLAFITAGVVLLKELQVEVSAIALGVALTALGVLSIVSYGVVRAIEWASRR